MINIKIYKLNIKLPNPLTISFHTWEYAENVLIVLEYDGIKGYGEAAPFKPITGDSQDEVIEQALKLKNFPFEPEFKELQNIHFFLDKQGVQANSLRAAVDFAFHDLVAKINNKPVYQLYRGSQRIVPNSVTVFIEATPEQTQQKVSSIFSKYPDLEILKIKLKGEDDFQRISVIKEVAPKNIKFILDANQGYEDEKVALMELTKMCEKLEKIILIEEPCPKGELAKLKYLKENLSGVLIFADESAATVEDVEKIVQSDCVHGVNIKLQKAGGIWKGKQIADLCIQNGLKIMVGSMLDGPFATAASTHFAVSTEEIILSDLDMDLDLPTFTTGQADFKNGSRYPSENFGLGVSINEEKLIELSSKEIVILKEII